MTKTIDTLVEDIYKIVDDGIPSIQDANMHLLLSDIEFAVTRQLTASERQDKNAVRMSNVGKPDRQLWYEVHGTEGEALTPDTRIKFLFGDIVEALVLFLVREAGHTVTDTQKEVEINGIKGHIDCIIDDVLVDVKSASPMGFKKFANNTLAEDDAFGYIGQLSSYKHAMDKKKAAFLAMDKSAGKLALMVLDPMDTDTDPVGRVEHVKEMVKLDTPPDRCYTDVEDGKSGNMKLPIGCSYCKFKHTCWADANDGAGLRTFFYSNGPRFLTKVEREPDVVEKQ
jgi:hypothetical protein